MPEVKRQTADVPHLDSTVGYRCLPEKIDHSKRTVVLVNSFCTSSGLFEPQFNSEALKDKVNLLAIEPLGHGATRTAFPHFTFWDSALVALQLMEKLEIKSAIAQGTSQGGWIVTRMALLSPSRISALIPCGTAMDAETQRMIDLGCWDGHAAGEGVLADLNSEQSRQDNFQVKDEFIQFLFKSGWGKFMTDDLRSQWETVLRENYGGQAGRNRLRINAINLKERDSIRSRVADITCPVRWLHVACNSAHDYAIGCFSVANAQEEIKLFTNSPDAQVVVVQGGEHFLSASNPEAVEKAILELLGSASSKTVSGKM